MKRFIGFILIVSSMFLMFQAGLTIREVVKGNPAANSLIGIEQDPAMLAIANELGLDVTYVNLRVGVVNASNVENAIGMFKYPNTITVAPGYTTAQIIAHEYMHYVWAHAEQEYRDVSTATYRAEKDSPFFKMVLDGYSCSEDCLANEAVAYSCSDMPLYVRSVDLNTFCAQFMDVSKL
jgi:hypothetical protein